MGKNLYLLAAIILGISVGTFASPTINGPTGLIEMPTAESLAYKQVSMGVDYVLGDRTDGLDSPQYYKFGFGTFENVELGFTGGTVPTEGVFVHAKYFLISDNDRYPLSIAVGIENVGSKDDTAAYLVTSKKFQGGVSAHFGFKATFATQLDASAMLGAEYMVDDRISFIGDLTGEGGAYVLNLGMNLYFDQSFTMRWALLDVTQNKNEETLYSLGISFARFL